MSLFDDLEDDDQLGLDQFKPVPKSPPLWSERTHADPIGDLREGCASIFLDRPLDRFERLVVRTGLTDGTEFPRRPS